MPDNYDDYDREELIKLLRERDRRPRFGLVWERKEIEHERAINNDFIALDLDESLSSGGDPYQNLIIEGDNFDALRYLRMTYAGKVKCIYIDPPYNTGNKDFVYNDRFVDKDDVYKHSKWLEFMYQRLQLARDLLSEDGVIFVSIDDNEQAHLKLLMDIVFGMNNFLTSFIWKRRSGSNDSQNFLSVDHEYIVSFQKSDSVVLSGVIKDLKNYKHSDNDERGVWAFDNLTCNKTKDERPNLFYDITDPETGLVYSANPNRVWVYERGRMQRMIEQGKVIFPKDGKGTPQYKRHLSELRTLSKPVSSWIYPSNTKDSFVGISSSINSIATKKLRDIFGKQLFDYPKPVDLLEGLINQATNKDSIVLDFFAGSGTTAHAVSKLNSADGGKRRFILVSNTEATEAEPDKNLCRDVCAERVRRVMRGYTNQKGEDVAGLGGSFAYLKTRRIASEKILREIKHPQVWTALQLIHGTELAAYNSDLTVQELQTETQVVLYLCKLKKRELKAVLDLLKGKRKILVYSWQPALLSQYAEVKNLTCLPIPQFLVERFSKGAKK